MRCGARASLGSSRYKESSVSESRDPQIVPWPGVTKPGSVCDEPTLVIDYYPTFAEIAGAQIPVKQKIDGTSIVPTLRGEAKLNRPAPLFWHYPADTGMWRDRAGGACRDGDFKLVELYQAGAVKLFNLKQDPNETKDLSAAMPEKLGELKAKLRDWQKSLGIELPKRDIPRARQ
jgi:arylsulfatase A